MASVCPYGRFTHAVVGSIPQSPNVGGVEVEVAKLQRQYGVLVGTLRQKVGLQVLEIPTDTHTNANLPESWRIEDMAIIQGDTALLTQPLNQERRQEVTNTHTHTHKALTNTLLSACFLTVIILIYWHLSNEGSIH